MFESVLETGLSKPVPVKIGCDYQGVKVRERGKVHLSLEFRLIDDTWQHHTSGSTLIITDQQKVFKFMGRQMWKIGQQI